MGWGGRLSSPGSQSPVYAFCPLIFSWCWKHLDTLREPQQYSPNGLSLLYSDTSQLKEVRDTQHERNSGGHS